MPYEPTKRFAVLSTGIQMAYVEAGQPGGKAVILLHGYTDSSRSFFPTLEALEDAGADLHVHALDLRGQGRSSMPPAADFAGEPQRCFSPAEMAADVIAFMDLKRIRTAHIVGHSFGSTVAQELALVHRARIDSVVLIGTFARSAGNAGVEHFLAPLIEGQWKEALERRPGFRWPQDAYDLTPRDADAHVEPWIEQNWAVELLARPDFVRQVVPETAGTKLGTWIGVLRSMMTFDNRERLKQLSVPALVIWATQDVFFGADDQAEVRAALDAAVAAGRTRYVFKTYGRTPLPTSGQQESDLGHNTQWGAPQAIADDITAWVKTGRPTADWPHADPVDVRRLVIGKGTAKLIEKP
ncbi:alpha/beta fold hydrolase [Ramlibacter sp. Leaf400]|uniref:alpha/beta fold hydrolase n=1 Tax=Ramlibacter sp. Leaf400 TaxID=1736365 RepID=UPI0006F93875|nr:alpha/beta hydrolase [Ramlibacter sp. Leaf400]KQT09332.1 hypothetical protein ASG30_12195 [Ramlibacter sp. Leaf400]